MGVREVSLKKGKRSASEALQDEIERQVKRVWRSALEAIEIRFGDDFDGYKNLRARILRVGNDAVRDLKDRVEKGYEVSQKQGTIEIRGKGRRDDAESA